MEYAIIALLTLLNGFFALSEIALVSVKRSRIEFLADSGNKSAKTVLELLKNPEDFLSSIQVGITLIGIVAGAYGWSAVAAHLEGFLRSLGFFSPHESAVAFWTAIAGITYFSIVVGELVPKSVAMNHAEKIALTCVPVLKYFMFLTYPFVKLLGLSTTAILAVMGVRRIDEQVAWEDELIAMLKTARHQGVIEKDEADAHKNLFSFSDLTARSLLTHRSDLEWIDVSLPPQEAFQRMAESAHSKFLVGDGSLDDVVGIVKFRDFMEEYEREGFDIRRIVTKPVVVTENTPAFKILQAFKKKKRHLAVVVDEYGGTVGIVTLHNLIEAIVGDLPDEDDEYEPDVVESADGRYYVAGKTAIHEFNKYFDREAIEGEWTRYATVAGYLLGNLWRMPRIGEKCEFDGISFEILDMDGSRIDRVAVSFAD